MISTEGTLEEAIESFCFSKFSLVRILPCARVHIKKSTLGILLKCQMCFYTAGLGGTFGTSENR